MPTCSRWRARSAYRSSSISSATTLSPQLLELARAGLLRPGDEYIHCLEIKAWRLIKDTGGQVSICAPIVCRSAGIHMNPQATTQAHHGIISAIIVCWSPSKPKMPVRLKLVVQVRSLGRSLAVPFPGDLRPAKYCAGAGTGAALGGPKYHPAEAASVRMPTKEPAPVKKLSTMPHAPAALKQELNRNSAS
jgi:hypothetical protein